MSDKPTPEQVFEKSLAGLSSKKLKLLLKEKKRELRKVKSHTPEWWEDYAQSLIDKMFSIWKGGEKWIQDVQRDGQNDCVVFSPTGRPRHLWAYLHDNRSVRNAMDRRGPNSIIQGNSSDIGYTASYLVARENWQTLRSKGIDTKMRLTNIIHDSNNNRILYEAAAIGTYLVEHGMTTLVSEHYKKIYDVDTPIHHLFDMELGQHGAAMSGWGDLRFDTLSEILEKYGEEQGLGRKAIGNCLHNVEAIGKVRLREVKKNAFEMTLKGDTQWYRDNMKGIIGI